MTSIKEYSLTCECGHSFKAPLHDSINITLDRSLLKKLYEEKINVVECPKCTNTTYVQKFLIFHDMDKELMINVREGEIGSLMEFLDSKGYFNNFKTKRNNICPKCNSKENVVPFSYGSIDFSGPHAGLKKFHCIDCKCEFVKDKLLEKIPGNFVKNENEKSDETEEYIEIPIEEEIESDDIVESPDEYTIEIKLYKIPKKIFKWAKSLFKRKSHQ